jgi:hypothetical protein
LTQLYLLKELSYDNSSSAKDVPYDVLSWGKEAIAPANHPKAQ